MIWSSLSIVPVYAILRRVLSCGQRGGSGRGDADGDLTTGGRLASQAEVGRLPHTRLLQLSTDLLKGKKASIDRNQSIKIRAAGIWAIYVESSRAMLREMNEL